MNGRTPLWIGALLSVASAVACSGDDVNSGAGAAVTSSTATSATGGIGGRAGMGGASGSGGAGATAAAGFGGQQAGGADSDGTSAGGSSSGSGGTGDGAGTGNMPDASDASTDSSATPTDAVPNEVMSSDAAGDGSPTTPAKGCGGCPTGERICGGTIGLNVNPIYIPPECVPTDDPHYGCGGCSPCFIPDHATVTCRAGACAMAACLPGWDDCDHDPANGCETNLLLPSSCGACGTVCAAGEKCGGGGCLSACSANETDCMGACVDLTTSTEFCGTCQQDCSASANDRVPGCNQSVCTYGCPSGLSICGTGCFDLHGSDPNHCGACDGVCPVPIGGTGECVAGACIQDCSGSRTVCSGVCVNPGTDGKNCGACGHDCGSMLCVAGSCSSLSTTVASGLVGAANVQVDHDDVFWFESGDLSVRKVSKLGGSPVILASGQPAPLTTRASPGFVALDDVHVYWASQSSVLRVRKDGTGQVELVATPATSPSVFRLDASDVYWVDSQGFTIFRIAKAGGAVQSRSVVGGVFNPLTQLGFDDTYVYFNFPPFGYTGPSQMRMSKDFVSTASYLAGGFADQGGVLFDGSTAYVVNGVSQLCAVGSFKEIHQVGGVGGVLAFGISCQTDGVINPVALFVDDTYLYWNDTWNSPGGLQQILKCGAGMTPVTLGPAITPTFDESYVYWSTGSTIMRSSK